MAYLRKRNKTYTAYIRRNCETIGKKKTYATFNFGKVSKETALRRLQKINRAEELIIDGILKKEQFKNHFSWLNPDGNEGMFTDLTLKQSINEFLDYKKLHIRKSSHKRLNDTMNLFLEIYSGKTSIRDFKTSHIIKFEKFYKSKLSKEGVNLNLRNLKTFFRWCFALEYIERVPMITIHKVNNEPKYISESDLIRIFNELPTFYNDLFKVYLETGKRRSELIQGQLIDDLLVIPVGEGLKTKKAHSIKLDKFQLKTIKELHKRRDEYIANGFKLYNFKNKIGKIFSKTCKKLDINGSLHSLRHSQAVMTYQETGDILQVKKKLNHQQLETTDYYSSIDENLREIDFPQSSAVAIEVEKLRKNAQDDKFGRQINDLN